MSNNQEKEKKKNLFIIITNSLQNDFIGRRYIEEIKNDTTEDQWKIDYDFCTEKWTKYFKDTKKPPEKLNINDFLNWMKNNIIDLKPKEILHSYHKFLEFYNHRVHIDIQQSERLWNDERLTNFIVDLMKKGAEANENESEDVYHFIHLRDWHDPTDIAQREELCNFGYHCIKGSHGAKFINPLAEYIGNYYTFNQIINSNSLSSFSDTNLKSILDTIIDNYNSSTEDARIGVFGVITNVKLKLLTFELKVIQGFKKVYLCGDLCAAFNQKGHNDGLNYMKNVLGVNVYNEKEFRDEFKF